MSLIPFPAPTPNHDPRNRDTRDTGDTGENRDDARALDTPITAGDLTAGIPNDLDGGDLFFPDDRLQAILDDLKTSRRDRAFALYTHGMRSSAIAAVLGVSSRTVRRWLQEVRDETVEDSNADYIAEHVRAVETQRAIEAACWEGCAHERALEQAILRGEHDYLHRRVTRGNPDSPDAVIVEEYERPHRPNLTPRYLAIAHAAQKEIARLHGLYTQAAPTPVPVRITVTRRPDASPDPASLASPVSSPAYGGGREGAASHGEGQEGAAENGQNGHTPPPPTP